MTNKAVITETPFNKRHCCWFCGEPNDGYFTFPANSSTKQAHNQTPIYVTQCPHTTLSVQCCNECRKIASGSNANHIWAVRKFVKKKLLSTYAKHLAIGVNWTKKQLAESDFEQGNFAGFARSAWFMYEVAKSRVNYHGWPLIVHGIELVDIEHSLETAETFNFDGVLYPSLQDAVMYYCDIFYIDKNYFVKVLNCISVKSEYIDNIIFAKTVRFCRLLVNASTHEKTLALQRLIACNKANSEVSQE